MKTDELLLEFDHWRDCAVGNYHGEMTAAQLESLAVLDAHIALPSSVADRAAWDESSLYLHLFWEELRGLAIRALNAFDWPQEIPPSYSHEYLRGKR